MAASTGLPTETVSFRYTKLTQTYREIDLKAFKELPDFKKLGESVQDLALQSVGVATGYAVKARETYDELAERGKGAVATWRGEGGDQDTRTAAVESGKAADAKPKAAAKPAPVRKPAAPRKPAAKKTDKPAE